MPVSWCGWLSVWVSAMCLSLSQRVSLSSGVDVGPTGVVGCFGGRLGPMGSRPLLCQTSNGAASARLLPHRSVAAAPWQPRSRCLRNTSIPTSYLAIRPPSILLDYINLSPFLFFEDPDRFCHFYTWHRSQIVRCHLATAASTYREAV